MVEASAGTSAQTALAAQANPISFCQCDRDWADPECGTQRKSQRTAFFWSLFLGFTGADYFYLGYPLWGLAKLFTLGGLGFWWLIDIVRIASGPVYAYNYRTANDLPHWVALLIVIFIFMMIGFIAAIWSYLVYRMRKREDIALLQNDEEARHWKNTQEDYAGLYGPRHRTKGPVSFDGRPGFNGYGTAVQMPISPNAAYANGSYAPYGGLVAS